MNVGEIITLFKQFANESDNTFLTPADIATYLGQGYREFRDLVTGLSPQILMQSQVYSLSGQDELDLATSTPALLNTTGSVVMTNLLHVVATSDAAGTNDTQYLEGGPFQGRAPIFGYSLEGTRLRFGGNRSNYLRIDFVADSRIQWDSTAAAPVAPYPAYSATVVPDMLVLYHPLIAFYGYRYYAIRDGALPPELISQMTFLEERLRAYLASGRDAAASNYVNAYNADFA